MPLPLPYRFRHWLDQRRIERALRPVDRTPPQPAADPGNLAAASAEVHMLLCRRDLWPGILALKSLLRYGPFPVTLTSDGSLAPAERALIDRHIPGCRWLDWPAAELAIDRALATRPRLASLYRSSYAPAAKLLHPVLLARQPRVVLLDPDTAFFARPERLLQFAVGAAAAPLYLHDHQDESRVVPAEVVEALRELQARLAPPGRTWGLGHRLFNSGLLAFSPAEMDLNLAEGYLQWLEGAAPSLRVGKPAIWFGPWTPEQTCYHLMFALGPVRPQPLGPDYHLGGQPNHVFNHFLRHYLVQPGTLKMLRGVVDSLTR